MRETTISVLLLLAAAGGSNALLRLTEPVNKFPGFLRYIVQRLEALCRTLGKVKIAEILAELGCISARPRWGAFSKSSRRPNRRSREATPRARAGGTSRRRPARSPCRPT